MTPRLRHITFTGIDERTDFDTIQDIQQRYPLAEFGILTSYHWSENGNRYLNPALIERLRNRNLNLALHICGSAAADAATGSWNKIDSLVRGQLEIFGRVQLNVANRLDNPDFCWQPLYIGQELIIQQRSMHEIDLFRKTLRHWPGNESYISVLLDASGGRGIDTPTEILDGYDKVGYAGGINPENVAEKLTYLMDNVHGDFWIDMESGVRTNDWFDVRKVRKVLKACEPIIKNR